MRFEQKGEWTISTPVYVGSSEAVLKAAKCAHEKWLAINRTIEHERLMVVDRCTECIATRIRHRAATEEEKGAKS